MPENPKRKEKIVILGGGISALTAAFELTSQFNWQQAYEITVYQLGWRLGGKCASGRNPEPEMGQRIEEHGVHVWFGFYDNAFRLIMDCYKEYKDLQEQGKVPRNGLAKWDDAFKKHNLFTVMEQTDRGWLPWPFDFPPNEKIPGKEEPLTPWGYVNKVLGWLVGTNRRLLRLLPELPPAVSDAQDRVDEWIEVVQREIVTAVEAGRSRLEERITTIRATLFGPDQSGPNSTEWLLTAAQQLFQECSDHYDRTPSNADPFGGQDVAAEFCRNTILPLLEKYGDDLRTLRHLVERAGDGARRIWILLRLGNAIAIGMIRDHVVDRGFEVIDDQDLTEWLQDLGIDAKDIWWSAPVRAIYDAVYAFAGGDPSCPNLAAGTALRGILRMFFDYKRAFSWKMQAGMGDTIFTPLYEVLRCRGVKFKFFHRIEGLHLSKKDPRFIDSIEMTIQATIKEEVIRQYGQYQPLCRVKDLWCWPSTPLYEQLDQGQVLKEKHIDLESAWANWPGRKFIIKRGEDFDRVILGIPLGYLPYICPELIKANDDWRDMVGQVQTVPTQAFQLWLGRTAEELGWEADESAIVAAFVEPIDTWADMSHLIDREDWRRDLVKNISYFCGPLKETEEMPDPFTHDNYLERQRMCAKDAALNFLRNHVRHLWPQATDDAQNPGCLKWDLLVDLSGQAGDRRFDSQFWRANADPSERYVLSVKGSTCSRLRADQSGFENLVLAGDWTYTGMNAGCVEAAVMSGLRAAKAICGFPPKIPGEEHLKDGGFH